MRFGQGQQLKKKAELGGREGGVFLCNCTFFGCWTFCGKRKDAMIFQPIPFPPQIFTNEVKWCPWCVNQLRKYFLPFHKPNHPSGKIFINPDVFTTASELCCKPKSNFIYHTWSFWRILFILLWDVWYLIFSM